LNDAHIVIPRLPFYLILIVGAKRALIFTAYMAICKSSFIHPCKSLIFLDYAEKGYKKVIPENISSMGIASVGLKHFSSASAEKYMNNSYGDNFRAIPPLIAAETKTMTGTG